MIDLRRRLTLVVMTFLFVMSFALLAVPKQAQAATCGSASVAPIITMQSAQAGTVRSSNSAYYQYVQFNTSGTGWRVAEAYFHPSTYLGGLPKKADGSLDYTRFAYRRSFSSPVTSSTFSVRRASSWLDGSEMHMGLYLKLVKLNSSGQVTQTIGAWGRSKVVNNAWYFKHMMWWCKPHTGSACANWWWASSSRYSRWERFRPTDNFNATFGRNALASNVTLGQALNMSGTGVNALSRHAVAALLNAAHSRVDYPYEVWQVRDKFRAAFDTGNYQSSMNVFYYANNVDLSCPM